MQKVLMFGWEFPPFKSGGLGQACRDLCKGLDHLGKEVTFVMPITPEQVGETDHADVIGARRTITNRSSGSSIHYKTVPTPLKPYSDPLTYSERVQSLMDTGLIEAESPEGQTESVYGVNLIDEVERYGRVAAQIVREQNFDVIHAHDWMTYRAGLVAREISGKPLVVHIHATEFDRTADNPTQEIEAREYEGLDRADLVIANSNWTRRLLKNPCSVSADAFVPSARRKAQAMQREHRRAFSTPRTRQMHRIRTNGNVNMISQTLVLNGY